MKATSLVAPYVGGCLYARLHIGVHVDRDYLTVPELINQHRSCIGYCLFLGSSFRDAVSYTEHRSDKELTRSIANQNLILSRTHNAQFSVVSEWESILPLFC